MTHWIEECIASAYGAGNVEFRRLGHEPSIAASVWIEPLARRWAGRWPSDLPDTAFNRDFIVRYFVERSEKYHKQSREGSAA